MRIPTGTVDQYVYFVAVDATDFTSRETGLSSFTVYRSRNGAAAAVMTTPTINEVDATNMPGVYELLLDEDMTIGAGNYTEEMSFHITHAGMAPVTRTIELYDPAAPLVAIGLDHLVSASVTGTDVTDNSIVAKLVSKSATADWDDFVNTTDALQAVADNLAVVDGVVDGIAASGTAFVVSAASYLGDFAEDETLDFKVFSYTSGAAPSTMSSATVQVYKDASATPIPSPGVTLSYDHNSITGMTNVTIDTSAAVTYSTGSNYSVRITATVDGDTVDAAVAEFSIENRYSSGGGLDAAGVRSAVGLASANLDTQLSAIDTVVDTILVDTNELQTNQGNWLTATGFSTHNAAAVVTAMGTGTFLTAIPWNASWDAEVQSECTDALTAYGASTLTADNVWQADLGSIVLTGNQAGKKVNDILVDTADLQANQGNWLTATGFATAANLGTLTDLGSGATVADNLADIAGATFSTTTDSLEAIRDRGDAAWVTGGGGSAPTEAEMYTYFTSSSRQDEFKATGFATSASLAALQITADTILDDTGTDIPAAVTAVSLKLGTPQTLGSGADLSNNLQDIAGGTFSNSTDSLEAIRNQGDTAWTTGSGGTVTPVVLEAHVPDSAGGVDKTNSEDRLYKGQDWTRAVPCFVDGIPYTSMSGATVTAQFVSQTSPTEVTTTGSVINCSDSGLSNYAAGIVAVVIPDTATTAYVGGLWTLEIKVVESGGDIRIFHATPPVRVIPTGQG